MIGNAFINKDGLTEKVIFEQRLGGERRNSTDSWGRIPGKRSSTQTHSEKRPAWWEKVAQKG